MYNFKNFPKQLDISLYTRETKEFLSNVEGIFGKNRFSIYSLGECELPGVSDLDFLIVGADKYMISQILQEVKKYMLIDKPLFISWNDIELLPYTSHHITYQYVGGEKINETFFLKNKKELMLIYAWKVLFFSGLRNIYMPFLMQDISVKVVLTHIYDLRYPVKYISNIISIDTDIENFILEFQAFRKNWFQNPDTDKLADFLERSIPISWRLIYILNSLIGDNKSDGIGFIYGRFPTLFENYEKFPIYQEKTEKYLTKYPIIDRFLILPMSMDYRLWNGELKDYLGKILHINSGFLPLGFQSRLLNFLLYGKKILDFLKISCFRKYEKN